MIKCKFDAANETINLDDHIMKDINPQSIVAYALIGVNPYGREGMVFVFTLIDNEIQVYIGNVFLNKPSTMAFVECLPETEPFFDAPSNANECCRKNWKCIPFAAVGHYVFVPAFIARQVEDNWEKLYGAKIHPDTIMVRGIVEACRSKEDKVIAMVSNDSPGMTTLILLKKEQRIIADQMKEKRNEIVSLKKSIVSLEQETEELRKQLIKLKRDERFIKAFTESSKSYSEIISILYEE